MKIFQVLGGFCHWDATMEYPTLDSTEGLFSSDILFVEAPDYVFEGWGYNPDAEGDDRFIKPEPPEGWLYDEKTGTFYQEEMGAEPSIRPSSNEQLRADIDYLALIMGVIL